MKWLIVGGDGQLGRAVSSTLQQSNSRFISLSHNQLDITNRKQILEIFLTHSPTIVLNCAAWTDVDGAEESEVDATRINGNGSELLAKASAEIGGKFIQISTDYVFSGNSTTPWEEDAPLCPVSAYGRGKAIGEELVMKAYPEGSYILRTSWLYSPWGKNFVKTMLKIATQEMRNVEVVDDQVGQPTSAIDFAEQIQLLSNRLVEPGVYHVTNTGQASWYELARKVFTLVGENAERITPISSSQISRPAQRPAYSVLSNNRWVREGFKPLRNWEVALEDAMPSIIRACDQGG